MATTVRDVETAYWDLVEAREQVLVAEESLGLARELHESNRVQVEVGTKAQLELVQSEAQIAIRDEDLIGADAAVDDAADQLRRLLNFPPGELWTLPISRDPDPRPSTSRSTSTPPSRPPSPSAGSWGSSSSSSSAGTRIFACRHQSYRLLPSQAGSGPTGFWRFPWQCVLGSAGIHQARHAAG